MSLDRDRATPGHDVSDLNMNEQEEGKKMNIDIGLGLIKTSQYLYG